MNWVRHAGSNATFETKSSYCRAAWQGLLCYTAVARLGFKRRATAVVKSNLIRSTEFSTAVARRLKWALNTLARLMNNEKKNHTMKSIQGRTKGKKDVDQVQRHEWLRATVTRHHCCSGRLKNSGVFFSQNQFYEAPNSFSVFTLNPNLSFARLQARVLSQCENPSCFAVSCSGQISNKIRHKRRSRKQAGGGGGGRGILSPQTKNWETSRPHRVVKTEQKISSKYK